MLRLERKHPCLPERQKSIAGRRFFAVEIYEKQIHFFINNFSFVFGKFVCSKAKRGGVCRIFLQISAGVFGNF
jgi:hypothetical protein